MRKLKENDNLSESLNELLDNINSELDAQKKINNEKSSLRNNENDFSTNREQRGTRIFDKINVSENLANNMQNSEKNVSDKDSSVKNNENFNIPTNRKTTDIKNIQPVDSSLKNARINTVDKTSEKENKHMKKTKKVKSKKYSVGGSLIKFIIYVVFVAAVSVIAAKYIIGIGNDMFAFVKDTYEIKETAYSTTGDTDNSLDVSQIKVSGNRLTFVCKINKAVSESERNSLQSEITLINAVDNSLLHSFGKFNDYILDEKKISLDLANANMTGGNYVLKISARMENSVVLNAEITVNKKNETITVPENATTQEVAKILKSNKIIDYPFAFNLYASFKKNKSGSAYGSGYISGVYDISPDTNYDDLLDLLSERASTRKIVKLTFPEGSTVDEIIDILIKGGVKNTREEYIDVINNYDFDYDFVRLLDESELSSERVYRLEGYLFPDTYEFYSDASPETVINKFLENFNLKFDKSFYSEAEKLGMTVDEIITIASLVEMEAGNAEDRDDIASVFHNRLNSVKNGNTIKYEYLQSDATTDYASYNISSAVSINKKGTGGSFNVDFSNYNLIDGSYYFNFNITTEKTRSLALLYVDKSTDANGNAVYKLGNVNVSNTARTDSENDLTLTITKSDITNSTLRCEFKLNHNYSADVLKKFPRKLNLFRTAYNTYLTKGIMPSAISNPGYDSITSALYPHTTGYYYFVADKTGKSHFTSSNEEHEAKQKELANNNMAVN